MGANAQTVVPTFTAGQVLTAAQMNQSARTGVPVFATTTDRDAAFGGSGEKTLDEGQLCYIEAAPNSLQYYTGAAWVPINLEWQAYTPTFTNLTVGNGTLTARYCQIGKTVFISFRLILGSTSSIGSGPTVTLPVTATSAVTGFFIGNTHYFDAGTASYFGTMYQGSTTAVNFQALNASQTYVINAAISATVPHTWAVNDEIIFEFFYEAA